MPSAEDLIQFQRLQNSAGLDLTAKLVENLPVFRPASLIKRYPDLAAEIEAHELRQKEWTRQLIMALRGGQGA